MRTPGSELIEMPRVAVLVTVVGVVGALVLLLPVEVVPAQSLLTDLSNLAAAALATGCTAWRAGRSAQRYRRSWFVLSAGCGLWTAGQLVWIGLRTADVYSFPSPADVEFLLFPPLAGLALLLQPTDGEAHLVRRVLDAVMAGLALGLIIWKVALGEVVRAASADDLLRSAVTIAYPALDLVLLVLTVLTLTRTPTGRLPLGLVTTGLLAFVVADIARVYQEAVHQEATGTNDLSPVALGWGIGFGCIAVAALVRPGRRRDPVTTPIGTPVLGFLPYVPVTVAMIVSVVPQLAGKPLPLDELLVATALVVMLLARQYLTLRQNWRLTARLAVREEQLRHQAFHDRLTGLANRALFRDRVEHAVDLHSRDLRPVSVLFLDLDDFKIVNDTLGHAAGDELLVRVSERLRGAVRTGDTVARLGGDEFAVLLEDGADPFACAARATGALRTPFDVGNQQVEVGASVGVVELAPSDCPVSADELLARADTAMYAAKRSGKARIVAHTAGMSLVELEDQRLRTVLRRAIAEGAIQLAYQPVIELRTGRTVALEALARWHHEGADVPPTTFIAAAARTGVLPELTVALLAEACAQLAEWSTPWSPDPLAVHVNIAPSQLVAPGFLRTVTDLVTTHGLRRGQLVLEITESGLVADLGATQSILTELRRVGVAVSLDDFGVGYSSLSRLNEIELDSVKIDRSFVDRIDSDPRRAAFLRGLLRLADDISLPVIAEGVERPGQLAELERLGCGLAQGYLLGRPVFAAEATARLGLPRSVTSA